jgi:hypothetical protein
MLTAYYPPPHLTSPFSQQRSQVPSCLFGFVDAQLQNGEAEVEKSFIRKTKSTYIIKS